MHNLLLARFREVPIWVIISWTGVILALATFIALRFGWQPGKTENLIGVIVFSICALAWAAGGLLDLKWWRKR